MTTLTIANSCSTGLSYSSPHWSSASPGGCDKGKPEDKAAKAAKAEDKAAKAATQDEQATKEAEPPLKEAKHFDLDADKSGVLARTAAVLETTDATSSDAALREHLAEISHHAEKISSDESLCQRIIELRKAAGQPEGDLQSWSSTSSTRS